MREPALPPDDGNLLEPWLLPDDAPAGWYVQLGHLQRTCAVWDRWCPDDGRPAAALAAVVRFLDDPTLAGWTALDRAATEVGASFGMAHAAAPAGQHGHAAWRATLYAAHLHALCASVLLAYCPLPAALPDYRDQLGGSLVAMEVLLPMAYPGS